MRKLTTMVCLVISVITFAQENPDDQPVNLNEINNKKHEIKIDAIEGLAVPALDISYEYVLSRYSGVGGAININLDGNNSDIDQNFALTGFYRQYFFNKKDYGARGFFAEGLLQYANGESNDTRILETPGPNGEVLFEAVNQDWNRFGIGFAIGQKWVSRNGFVLELSLGAGRYLGNTNDDESFNNDPEGFFRGGVSVGYRF
ncbi:hypothetical protein ACFO3O_16745 [Dokdonia ponticola]|uniref:DUF3575 domain-containing protein n=1 Tax=Dokdonia ponticola TaxID=2041041 RepID=A0ABV9HZH5_9FLAO